MPFRFEHPEYLWLLLLAAPILWLGLRSLATLDTARRWIAIIVRVAVLVLLVFILAGFQMVKWHRDLTVVAVVDESESVRRFARPGQASPLPDVDPTSPGDVWASRFLAQAMQGRKLDDRIAVVGFDGKPFVRSMPSADVTFDTGAIVQPSPGTDLASSIRLGMAMFPADNGRRMVLASDGNDTIGGALALLDAAREARAAGIPIDVLPIEYKVENEVTVDAVYNPVEARQGQTVGLRIVLRSTRPARGKIYIKHDGKLLLLGSRASTTDRDTGASVRESDWTPEAFDSSGSTTTNTATNTPAANTTNTQPAQTGPAVNRYVCIKTVDLPMTYSGINRFEVEFQPDKGFDQLPGNNKAESFALVQGKGRTLFVDGLGGEPGSILPKDLQARGYDIDIVGPESFPTRLADLQRYDCVIFQNVPVDNILPGQQQHISRYVTELGGGFIMVGGPDSFGAGGWTATPIDRLLPVECQIPNQKIMPSGALIIVMDHSGSMSAPVAGTNKTQQHAANEAAVLAVQTLYPDDLVCVIVFDHEADIVVPMRRANSGNIPSVIRSISPSGGTNIISGLELAANEVVKLGPQQAAVRHVMLLTDGQSADGNYAKVIGQMVKSGATLSTVGVGDGVNGQLLQSLAQMGGGTYYPIRNPAQLPQVFIKEARTVRKKLIKEEPFTPRIISTGSPITAGISGYPGLKGFVLTGEKRDARVFTPLVGPEREPVFAHWQIGLGRSAAFTSDASNRWATNWLGWSGYSDFWVRTLRLIARPGNDSKLDLVTTTENGRIKMRLDAGGSLQELRNSGAPFLDFMRVKGSVVGPDGTVQTVTLLQTGPGLYEASAPADLPGSYVVSLIADDSLGGRHATYGGTTLPPGEELRKFQSNRNILEQVAQITGGRILDPKDPSANLLFDRTGVQESRSIKPMWYTLLTIALILFIIDVAARRLAFDIAGGLSRLRKRFFSSQPVGSTEEEAKQTLAALKKVVARDPAAAQAKAQANGAAPMAAPSTASQTAQTQRPRADRKFEAAPSVNAPTGNLGESVGGAGGVKASDPAVMKKPGQAAADEGPTTNRLLAAKKRAQDRIDDKTG